MAKGSEYPWPIPSLLLVGTYADLLRSSRRASGVKEQLEDAGGDQGLEPPEKLYVIANNNFKLKFYRR